MPRIAENKLQNKNFPKKKGHEIEEKLSMPTRRAKFQIS